MFLFVFLHRVTQFTSAARCVRIDYTTYFLETDALYSDSLFTHVHTLFVVGSGLGLFFLPVFLVSISATLCASHDHNGQVETPLKAFLDLL